MFCNGIGLNLFVGLILLGGFWLCGEGGLGVGGVGGLGGG